MQMMSRGGQPVAAAGGGLRARHATAAQCGAVRAGVLAGLVLAVTAMLPVATAMAARYAAMVVDANSGQVLHAEAADEPRYPASLTKMMTLYLVFEQLEQGRLKPDTRIHISPNAAATSPSKLGLPAGQTIAVADAVKALITKSANDIAVAVAEHLAGTEERFAQLMTQKARELGMTATTFRNPHGLPDGGQRTTARDMITLGLRLHDRFPRQVRLFALRSFTYAGRTHRNHNTMLDSFPGMEGMKTGYTTPSGYNLVASVRRDGRHVVAAVFGGNTAAARNARMRLILSRSLPKAATEVTRQPVLVAKAPAQVQRVPVPRLAERPRPAAMVAASRAAEATPAPAIRERERAVVNAADEGWRSQVRMAAPAGGASTLLAMAQPPPAPAAGLARPPSSLQAQASSLGMRAAPAPAAARPPARQAAGATLPGGVEVQIGAYPAETEARQRLDEARQRSRLLAGAGIVVPAVTVNGRRLYRARFTGLDPDAAATACAELRRQQIDCHVARAE